MLDPKFVYDNKDFVIGRTATRGFTLNLDEFIRLTEEKKTAQKRSEELRTERNRSSELVSQYKREKKDASELIAESRKIGDEIQKLDDALRGFDEKIRTALPNVPNLPHESVPVGKDSADNVVVRTWGEPSEFDFPPLAHWDIGTKLGILDFERAGKITGSRFTVYLGAGARLERQWRDLCTNKQVYLHFDIKANTIIFLSKSEGRKHAC